MDAIVAPLVGAPRRDNTRGPPTDNPGLRRPRRGEGGLQEEPLHERPMATGLVDAGGGAEERDRLLASQACGEGVDPVALARHLLEETALVRWPRERRPRLSVGRCMEGRARRERRAPDVPGLVLLPHAARAIAADEQAGA